MGAGSSDPGKLIDPIEACVGDQQTLDGLAQADHDNKPVQWEVGCARGDSDDVEERIRDGGDDEQDNRAVALHQLSDQIVKPALFDDLPAEVAPLCARLGYAYDALVAAYTAYLHDRCETESLGRPEEVCIVVPRTPAGTARG